MTQQDEDKGKTTQSTPVQDEQAKTKPAKGELPDEELEKATGGLGGGGGAGKAAAVDYF
jgi:hypothetical protein